MNASRASLFRTPANAPAVSRGACLGFGVWALMLAIAVTSIWITMRQGYRFDSNILALLPTTQQDAAQAKANRQQLQYADDQLLILLRDPNPERSLAQVRDLHRHLLDSGLFARVDGPTSATQLEALQNTLHPWRYHLVGETQGHKLQSDGGTLVNEALGRLYSPLATLIAPTLVDDPIQLHFLWRLEAMPATTFEPRQGWLSRDLEGDSVRLVRAHLAQPAYNVDYQQQVIPLLERLRENLAPSSKLLVSGLIVHAAYGAAQARQEISTIGLGSAIGITLLLGLCFARLRYLLLALLPLTAGCTLALALCLAVFEQVHLITLAFGASLVGVAIDYPLHFFCSRREAGGNGSPHTSLRRILPGLTLGLVSSMAAYAAQAAAPFPGLRQMALFSATGLAGAWLTVVCCLPLLTPAAADGPRGVYPWLLSGLQRWLRYVLQLRSGLGRWLLGAVILSALVLASQLNSRDDLRVLQTSPEMLLRQDAQVQAAIGGDNPGQYFLVEGNTEQALLQKEQAFMTHLRSLQQQGVIAGFNGVSKVVAPLATQEENLRLQRDHVYAEGGLLTQLVQKAGLSTLENEARESFTQNAQQEPLRPAQWLQSAAGEYHRRLWLGAVNHQHFSLISLNGIRDQAAIAQLSAAADLDPAVTFVDRVGQTSALLSNYRQQLVQWLLGAYVLVISLLLLRYGKHSWRIVAAPAAASVMTLASLYLAGSPFTIFHGLALLLILGIGLDASIFMTESRCSPHTWIAISLSSATTLLAFGLLALSNTPVLHFFGQTVFIGIIAVWLLTPCFVAAPSIKDQSL